MANSSARKALYWTPRILNILFILFISMFAMDVFRGGYGFPKIILALLIHLIPGLILLAVLLVSWRWEWVGGILFPLLGIFHIVTKWGILAFWDYMMIDGPAFLLGILYFWAGSYAGATPDCQSMPVKNPDLHNWLRRLDYYHSIY